MQSKSDWTTNVQRGDEHLERMIEKGRHLHDQAVFDCFWILSRGVRSTIHFLGERLSFHHTPPIQHKRLGRVNG